ncbi:uracil-DNA glycosylase family protein [Nocardioides sp. YIM 152588]|uniref:uracil-DNA glycosylase family protein n=1 Tax=Nocardioides sp. YIM 152588 TaxID=3158259 RepID=UPI0032E5157C
MLDFDPGGPPVPAWDKGPPIAIARHFAALPPIAAEHRELFWYDWGPVFYRGRLNGTARVLGIASDPGPTERLVGRTLVGDAGQRVQGFLAKIGLTSTYALVNAFPWAVHPSDSSKARKLLEEPDQLAWRNRFYDLVTDSRLEAIVAFGQNAQAALALWERAPDVPVVEIPHPSSHDAAELAARWAEAVTTLRAVVAPDPDGDATGPNYGAELAEEDYARIPPGDLPYGVPVWIGDDRWGRTSTPRHHNPIKRSTDDADHAMVWQAPQG